MTSLRSKIVILVLGGVAFCAVPGEIRSDILFKGKQPLRIGLGQQVGGTIKWTDCSGKNPESFSAPPYALDSADNCSVGPATFGLQCDGESCKVVDAEKLGRYVPGVRNGQRVILRIQEHSVEMKTETTTLRLER